MSLEQSDEEISIYEGDYAEQSTSLSQYPMSRTPQTTMKRNPPSHGDRYIPYEVLFRTACLAHRSLVATGAQVVGCLPDETAGTRLPLRSDTVPWIEGRIPASHSDEENDVSVNLNLNLDDGYHRILDQYLQWQGRRPRRPRSGHAAVTVASVRTTPSKLVVQAASLVLSPVQWLTHSMFGNGSCEEDGDDDHGSGRVGSDDCIVNLTLTRECVQLLTQFLRRPRNPSTTHRPLDRSMSSPDNPMDEDIPAVFTTGTHRLSWCGWLQRASVASAKDTTGTEQDAQLQLVSFLQDLPLPQLDLLWRILEHERLLERVLDPPPRPSAHSPGTGEVPLLPRMLVWTPLLHDPKDRDMIVTRLELQHRSMTLETALAKHSSYVQQYTQAAMACKRHNRPQTLLIHTLQLRRLHQKRFEELQSQRTMVQALLLQLEGALHSQSLVQLLASTTETLRAMRLEPEEEATTIVEAWTEEMENWKDLEQVVAKVAGEDPMGDDALLAELATLADPSTGMVEPNEIVSEARGSGDSDLVARLRTLTLKEQLADLPIVVGSADSSAGGDPPRGQPLAAA